MHSGFFRYASMRRQHRCSNVQAQSAQTFCVGHFLLLFAISFLFFQTIPGVSFSPPWHHSPLFLSSVSSASPSFPSATLPFNQQQTFPLSSPTSPSSAGTDRYGDIKLLISKQLLHLCLPFPAPRQSCIVADVRQQQRPDGQVVFSALAAPHLAPPSGRPSSSFRALVIGTPTAGDC